MADVKIGVLALQGAFREHIQRLNSIDGVTAVAVRTGAQLQDLDGLVLPGGESTTMGLVAERSGILGDLRAFVASKKPLFATCAGLIMLAKEAHHEKEGGQPLLGGLDVVVDRNFFGSQLQSFETDLMVNLPGQEASTCHGVFIRAPVILETKSDAVQVLGTLTQEQSPKQLDGKPCIVAAQQEHLLVTAFHPELTADIRWHAYFVTMVKQAQAAAS